jgi:hypothetical protein
VDAAHLPLGMSARGRANSPRVVYASGAENLGPPKANGHYHPSQAFLRWSSAAPAVPRRPCLALAAARAAGRNQTRQRSQTTFRRVSLLLPFWRTVLLALLALLSPFCQSLSVCWRLGVGRRCCRHPAGEAPVRRGNRTWHTSGPGTVSGNSALSFLWEAALKPLQAFQLRVLASSRCPQGWEATTARQPTPNRQRQAKSAPFGAVFLMYSAKTRTK